MICLVPVMNGQPCAEQETGGVEWVISKQQRGGKMR